MKHKVTDTFILYGGNQWAAVDGNKQCTRDDQVASGHNALGLMKYFRADMGSSKHVDKVVVTARSDRNDRLNNYWVTVGDDHLVWKNPWCSGNDLFSGSATVTCNLKGRYFGIMTSGG